MKKLVSLALSALSAFALLGATLQTVTDPKPGELGLKASGRIAAVDVFSTVADGTVEISRVFSAPFYTNAYDITSAVFTNIVREPIVDRRYVLDGVAFTNKQDDLNFIRFVSTASDTNILVYTHSGMKWVYEGDRGGAMISGEPWQKTIDFSGEIGADTLFERVDEIVGYDVTTNIVTVVMTNSVTPVKAYDLVVTNEIFSGACEGNCFHGVPSPDVWVFPGDRILFGGTATGGALRLVIE